MKETFYTAAKSIQIINKVKDSKFYGSISRADTREEALEFINKIKEMYRMPPIMYQHILLVMPGRR